MVDYTNMGGGDGRPKYSHILQPQPLPPKINVVFWTLKSFFYLRQHWFGGWGDLQRLKGMSNKWIKCLIKAPVLNKCFNYFCARLWVSRRFSALSKIHDQGSRFSAFLGKTPFLARDLVFFAVFVFSSTLLKKVVMEVTVPHFLVWTVRVLVGN